MAKLLLNNTYNSALYAYDKKMKPKIIITSIFLLISTSVIAGPDEELQDCLSKKENYTTSGITNCTNKAADNWDKELNRVYKELMSKLTPEGKQSLKEAQIQWIKFRDKEHQLIADIYDRRKFSGTMYIPMRSMDILQVTKKRTLELTKYYEKHK